MYNFIHSDPHTDVRRYTLSCPILVLCLYQYFSSFTVACLRLRGVDVSVLTVLFPSIIFLPRLSHSPSVFNAVSMHQAAHTFTQFCRHPPCIHTYCTIRRFLVISMSTLDAFELFFDNWLRWKIRIALCMQPENSQIVLTANSSTIL